MSLKKGDTFTLNIEGTVRQNKSGELAITFEGEAKGSLHFFDADWFETRAVVADPTPIEFYRSLPVGAKFQFANPTFGDLALTRIKLSDGFYSTARGAGRPEIRAAQQNITAPIVAVTP